MCSPLPPPTHPTHQTQTITWQKMFQRELNLREAMKRIVAVMWSADVPPAVTGYTAHDIIIGVESGEGFVVMWVGFCLTTGLTECSVPT